MFYLTLVYTTRDKPPTVCMLTRASAREEIHATTRDKYGLKAGGLLQSLEKFGTLCIGYITRWRSLCDLHTEDRRSEAV